MALRSGPRLQRAEFCKQFSGLLSQLTFNSKDMIDTITKFARSRPDLADDVVFYVSSAIRKAPTPDQRLNLLYVMDSICKNIGDPYVLSFTPRLQELFFVAFDAGDQALRSQLLVLLQSWEYFFPKLRAKALTLPAVLCELLESIISGRAQGFLMEKHLETVAPICSRVLASASSAGLPVGASRQVEQFAHTQLVQRPATSARDAAFELVVELFRRKEDGRITDAALASILRRECAARPELGPHIQDVIAELRKQAEEAASRAAPLQSQWQAPVMVQAAPQSHAQFAPQDGCILVPPPPLQNVVHGGSVPPMLSGAPPPPQGPFGPGRMPEVLRPGPVMQQPGREGGPWGPSHLVQPHTHGAAHMAGAWGGQTSGIPPVPGGNALHPFPPPHVPTPPLPAASLGHWSLPPRPKFSLMVLSQAALGGALASAHAATASAAAPLASKRGQRRQQRRGAGAGVSTAGASSAKQPQRLGPFATVDGMRVDVGALAHPLYFALPHRCTNCGTRFRSEAELHGHLDWHFKQKRQRKSGSRRAVSRAWYSALEAWAGASNKGFTSTAEVTFFDEAVGRGDRSGGGAGGATNTNESGSRRSVPVDDAQTACPVCQRKFQAEMDAESGEWVYVHCEYVTDAVGTGDEGAPVIVHTACADDYRRARAADAETARVAKTAATEAAAGPATAVKAEAAAASASVKTELPGPVAVTSDAGDACPLPPRASAVPAPKSILKKRPLKPAAEDGADGGGSAACARGGGGGDTAEAEDADSDVEEPTAKRKRSEG